MRQLLAIPVMILLVLPARGYQYWNDIRSSALLPDTTVVVRVENPSGSGEENYLLYRSGNVAEVVLLPTSGGPSTLSATAPGPVGATMYYGFRLMMGDELDFMPVRLEDGADPVPGELTRVATDAEGDALFGYENLDLVDCRVGFSGTELHASLTNAGGGFPVSQLLTFFGYLLGVADPEAADPDTIFALMQTYEQAGIISPGLYKITGTGLSDLEKIGDVVVQEYPAQNTLSISCQLADLLADPYFQSWYDPADPRMGVAGFTQRITLLNGAEEADRSPGGTCHLREFSIAPGANQLPVLSGAAFVGDGPTAAAEIDYADPDGHCPVLAEIVFDGADTFSLYPQSTDYSVPVTYRTDDGIAPLAGGSWQNAEFRFSDNLTDVVVHQEINTGVAGHLDEVLAMSVSANPVRTSTAIELFTPVSGPLRVAVYDARGATVRTLTEGTSGVGRVVLEWDGRSDDGGRVASGIYFLKADSASCTAVRKLVVLR